MEEEVKEKERETVKEREREEREGGWERGSRKEFGKPGEKGDPRRW